MTMEILHIYGQQGWHDEAHIVGTEATLLKLRDAIDFAMRTGIQTSTDAFVNDGEGYSIHIHRMTEEQAMKCHVPYHGDLAGASDEEWKNATWMDTRK